MYTILLFHETHDRGMRAGIILPVQVSSESRPCGESVSSPLDRIYALAVPVGGQFWCAIGSLI